jgi:fimbrial isopeptide formation D2 family protein/uncharacterized repeat protein (TIGR01451 family)
MDTRRNVLAIRGPSCWSTALALACCCAGWLVPASSQAQSPAPRVQIQHTGADGKPLPGLPPEVLIGEDFHFQLKVSPDPVATGFAPFVELYLQFDGADCTKAGLRCDGLLFASADARFTSTILALAPCPAGTPTFVFAPSCSAKPLCPGTTSDSPSCFFGADPPACSAESVAGFQKVVLELPLPSFVPGQPPVILDVAVHVDSFANDGFPLTIKARGGFRYADKSFSGPPSLDATCPMVSADTIPRVFRLTKDVLRPEDETATGPNFPLTYKISVDVAQGQTVAGLEVQDCFSGSLVFLSSTAPGAAFDPGSDCLFVDFPSLTGGLADPDASFTFNAFVPDLDLNGKPILGPSCKTAVPNQVSATAQWTPLDPRESPSTVTARADHQVTAKCIALQKSVRVVNDPNGPRPGDTLQYRLDFQISDFRTFRGLVLDDYLSDGLTLVPGSAFLTVSDQQGSLGGPALGRFSLGHDLVTSVFRNSQTGDVFTCNDGTNLFQPTLLEFQISQRLSTMASAALGSARHVAGILTGGLAGGAPSTIPAIGTIFFRARINEDFQRQPVVELSVKKDDPLPNCAVIRGDVLDNESITSLTLPHSVIGAGDDDSLAPVTVVAGILRKSIFAVNGKRPPPIAPPPAPPLPLVAPGDLVTFELNLPIPAGDAGDLSFTDFLPLPIFHVSPAPPPLVCLQALPIPASLLLNNASQAVGLCPAPPVPTASVAENSLHFPFGTVDSPPNVPASADLFLTLQASADPFPNGLRLTNHVIEQEKNSFGVEFDQTEVAEFVMGEPKLRIRKGVVKSDKVSAVFTPSPPAPPDVKFRPAGSGTLPAFSGVISSDNVGVAGGAAPPEKVLHSDASNLDGCDLVRFVIAVENLGSSPKGAFDVRLADMLPACLTVPFGLQPDPLDFNLQVVNGRGVPLTCHGGQPCSSAEFFGPGGIQLDNRPGAGALGPFSTTGGDNIAVITFDARVPCHIAATGCCTNTAKLLHYAGVAGGPDHTQAGFSTPFPDTTPVPPSVLPSPFADAAQVCVQPQLQKSIVATSEPSTGPSAQGEDLTIGEIVRYRLQVEIPNGASPGMSLSDTLPPGLVWLLPPPPPNTCALVTQSPSVTTTITHPTPAVSPDGQTLTFSFGNVTNHSHVINPENPEVLTVECDALVLNRIGPAAVNHQGDPRPNSFTVQLEPAPHKTVTFTSNAVPAVIVEPAGELVKRQIAAVPPAEATYLLSYTNTGKASAFDVVIDDPLPAQFSVVGGVTLSGSGCTLQPAPPLRFIVTCPEVPPGGTVALTFGFEVLDLCQQVTNQATLTYSSLPGLHGTVPNRTRAVTPGDPGAPRGERIYHSTAAAVFTSRCPDLAIEKRHSNPFNPFVGGSYTVTVTNVGNAPSVPADTVTDVLPNGLRFISGGDIRWLCTAVGATVTCVNLGPSIPPGGSSSFTIVVAPQWSGPFDNCATVATTLELNLDNNRGCDHVPGAGPDLYVGVAFGHGSVDRFDGRTGAAKPSSGNLGAIFTLLNGSTTGSMAALGLAFGPGGVLYVADALEREVKRFDAMGNPFGSTGFPSNPTFIPATAFPGGVPRPRGLALGQDGWVYLTGDGVLRFDSQGTIGTFVANVSTAGLTFGGQGNDLYVTTETAILRYDHGTGALVGPTPFATFAPTQFPTEHPDLTFGPDGDLYVTSFGESKVLRFSPSGTPKADFVGAGSGGLFGPVGLAFGPDGNLYVSSSFSFQILRYDGATGAFLGVFATEEAHQGEQGSFYLIFGP